MRKRDLLLTLGIVSDDDTELRVDEYSCLCATVPGGELAIDLDDGRVLLRRDDGPTIEGLDAVRLVVEGSRPPAWQHTARRDDSTGALRCVFCEQELSATDRGAACPAADPARAVALGVGLYELGAEQPPPPESDAQRVRREQIEVAEQRTRTPRRIADGEAERLASLRGVRFVDVETRREGAPVEAVLHYTGSEAPIRAVAPGPYSNAFNGPPLNAGNLRQAIDRMREIAVSPSTIILPPGVHESLAILSWEPAAIVEIDAADLRSGDLMLPPDVREGDPVDVIEVDAIADGWSIVLGDGVGRCRVSAAFRPRVRQPRHVVADALRPGDEVVVEGLTMLVTRVERETGARDGRPWVLLYVLGSGDAHPRARIARFDHVPLLGSTLTPRRTGFPLERARLRDLREGDRVAGLDGAVYEVERVGHVALQAGLDDRLEIGVRGLGALRGAPDEEVAVAVPRRLRQHALRSGDVVRRMSMGDHAPEFEISTIDRRSPPADIQTGGTHFAVSDEEVFELIASPGWRTGDAPIGPADLYRVPLAERIPADSAAPEVAALAVDADPESLRYRRTRGDTRDRAARDVEIGDWVRFDPSPTAGTRVVVDVSRRGGAAGTVSLWYSDGQCETLTPQRRCEIIAPHPERITCTEVAVGDVVRFSEPGASDTGWVRVIEVRPRSQGRVQLRYRGPETVDGRATLAPAVEVLRRNVPRPEGIVFSTGTGTPPARP